MGRTILGPYPDMLGMTFELASFAPLQESFRFFQSDHQEAENVSQR